MYKSLIALGAAGLCVASASLLQLPTAGQDLAQAGFGGYLHYSEAVSARPSRPGVVGLDLEFSRTSSQEETFVELILVKSDHLNFVGQYNGDQVVSFCCTEESVAAGVTGCLEAGTLIVDPAVSANRKRIVLASGKPSTEISETFSVTESGKYQLLISKCSRSNDDLSVSGNIAFKHSTGFLSNTEFGFLPIYGTIAGLFGLLLNAWLLGFLRINFQMIQIHKLLTAVLLVSVLSAVSYCAALGVYNAVGLRNRVAFGLMYFMNALRHTVARVFFLLACTGYGVVSREPAVSFNKISLLGAVFFCLRLTFEFPQRRSIPGIALAGTMLLFDFAGLVVTYITSKSVLEQLEDSENMKSNYLKKIMKFFEIGAIVVALLVTVCVFALSGTAETPIWMVVCAVGESFYLAGLLFFTVLLWPSETIKLYAEFEQVAGNEDEDNQIVKAVQEMAQLDVSIDDQLAHDDLEDDDQELLDAVHRETSELTSIIDSPEKPEDDEDEEEEVEAH